MAEAQKITRAKITTFTVLFFISIVFLFFQTCYTNWKLSFNFLNYSCEYSISV